MLIGVVWVITTNGNPELAPWYIGIGALPHLLLTGFVPKWLERLGALRAVILSDLLRGILLLALLPLFFAGLGTGHMILLFSLNFLINVFAALFNPAILVLPTRITNDEKTIQQTTAVVENCFSLANVIAPVLSVWCYSAFGLGGLILTNGISYLIAAYIENGIRELPPAKAAGGGDAQASEKVSLASIRGRDPLLVSMLAGFFLLNLCLGPILVFIPLFAKHIYQGTLGTVGYLETALAGGTLLGGTLLTIMPTGIPKVSKIFLFLAIDCIAYLLFSISAHAIFGIFALGALGFALSIANVLILNFFQTRAAPQEIPTIMSWVNMISVATLPLSMAAVGFVFQVFGSGSIQAVAVTLSAASLLLLLGFVGVYTIQNSIRDSAAGKERAYTP